MLLVYQIEYRHSGAEPWKAAIEIESEEEAREYIASAIGWQHQGDGYGTLFGLVPNGFYCSLSDKWAWVPSEMAELYVEGYEPY